MEPDFLRRFAETIAMHAGDSILMKGFMAEDTEVSYKSRTNLLTSVDTASEKYLYETIRKEFPDHSIVAEEGSINRSDNDIIWYIDPLDATNNFAHGIPHFCVSVGAYSRSNKSSIAGAVYDPCRKELFSAAKGKGAKLNGKEMRVSVIEDIGISLLATGFPYDKANHDINNLIQFNAFLPLVQCVRRFGSAALDLCYVGAGRLEGYWEPMLNPWDTAAGALIVEEAGGRVTQYDGTAFDPLVPELIASNGRIHGEMARILLSATKILPRNSARSS
jgi:myo-inositol-1(or 4)-monophosphatase